jgi:hypothetical protein
VKKSVIARAFVALMFVVATVFAGATTANATAGTLAFDGSTPTFTAGMNSPVMQLLVTPSNSSTPYNKAKIEILDSTGTSVETSGRINMPFSGHSLADCFTQLVSPFLGCDSDGDDAGFFELSNGTTGALRIPLDGGLFTLPTNAGSYTIRVGLFDGGTLTSSATVGFTQSVAQFTITFGNREGSTGTQASITTNGPTFTLPANTLTPPSGKQFAGWNDYQVSNVILNAGASYTVSRNTELIPVWSNIGGNQQQNQSVSFTVGSSSFQRGSAPSFSTLAVGANVPAYTMTFGGYSSGGAVNQINYLLGDPYNDIFYTVPGSVSNNSQNYAAWDPSSSTCGITAIRIGGVAQTANSGITCVKSTSSVSGSATQYWNAVKFATPTSAEISIDTAAGVFVVSQAGNLNYFATLFNNSLSPRWMSNVSQAFDGANPSSSSAPASPVSFTIPVAPGQRIVGEDVAIAATDLALSTDYSVVLRSTPQILASGRTVSSSFNTSVTIPNNLEPGWHSITFNATRSDGAAVEEKVYFKITADGTLLASTTETPAELAFTGALTAGAIPLSIIALVMGFIAFFVAREINPDFMRVMTLTRNEDGELDFVKRRIRSIDF